MSSVAQRIFDHQAAYDHDRRRVDFANVVKFWMLGGGPARAAELAVGERANERVIEAIKASVDPISIGSVGTALSPFALLSQSFMQSLASATAFDRMLGDMLKLPMRSKVVSITSQITGATLQERDVKRLSSLSLSNSDLDIYKAAALVAVTREVLTAGGSDSLQFLERELQNAVSRATDSQFISLITSGAPSIASSGGNANAMRTDLRTALQMLTWGASSRLYIITTPDIAAALATAGDNQGAAAFTGTVYNGGSAAGIPIIVSDSCPAGAMILADATGIAAASEGLRIDSADSALLQMDSAPDSPPTASTSYVNLWAQNMVAIRCERFFTAKRIRTDSVVMVTGASYIGGSPT